MTTTTPNISVQQSTDSILPLQLPQQPYFRTGGKRRERFASQPVAKVPHYK
jgi:hypothetical protein